jgi:hypothetical protein
MDDLKVAISVLSDFLLKIEKTWRCKAYEAISQWFDIDSSGTFSSYYY